MLTHLLIAAAVAPFQQDDADLAVGSPPPVPQTVEVDEPASRQDFTGMIGPAESVGLENPNYVPRPRNVPADKPAELDDELFRTLSIRDLLTEPTIDEPGDGRVWVRGREYRASFGEEGFAFYPVFGRRSPQEYPVAFDVAEVTAGGLALELASPTVGREGSDVALDHGSMREIYHIGLDEVEQTFVFDTLPATGEIVVRMGIETELVGTDLGETLRFAHPEFGHVDYGAAIAFDAVGNRTAVSRTFTGDTLELTVPASFVQNAVLPLTIDPEVNSFSNGFGVTDDRLPDIAYDGVSSRWWVVWEEYTSATNADCYVTSWNASGTTQGSSFGVEITGDDWQRPKIAYNVGWDTLLVVAQATVGTSGRIAGRRISGVTNAVAGSIFTISTTGFRKLTPDVGGTDRDSTTNSHFLVVWAFEAGTGNRNVQYRMVDGDGSFVTTVQNVDTSSSDDDIQTTCSKSTGDDDLLGDWYTIAWTRDTNGDGRGQIMARRVVWSGNFGSGNGNFIVDGASNNSWPSVTSRLDDNLVAESDRPSIVAYQTRFPAVAGGFQHSIYARVVTDGTAYAENSVSYTLEDVDLELDQIFPSIATDGNAYYITYAEEYWNNVGGGDYDMYMLSGHLSQTSNNAYLALCERHQNLSFSGSAELNGEVATKWDGTAASTSDDGCAIWHDGANTGNGGRIEGATLEVPTIDVSPNIAVGRQFCDALPNSRTSPYSDDVSGWTWMEGTQSLGSNHRVYAVDVPNNAFGYLLASMTPANISMPGSTMGQLCQVGSGRYVNALQSSGSSGTYLTTVNPMNMPQPTGFVSAAPGETWLFTYWHRDSIGGVATSNFTSNVRVMFAP